MKLNLNFIIGIILIFGILVYLNGKKSNLFEGFSNFPKDRAEGNLQDYLNKLESKIQNMNIDGGILNQASEQRKVRELTNILKSYFGKKTESQISQNNTIPIIVNAYINAYYDENEKKMKDITPEDVKLMVKLLNLFFELVSNKLILFFTYSSLNDNISENYINTQLIVLYNEVKELLEYIAPVYTKLKTIDGISDYDQFYIPDDVFVQTTIDGLKKIGKDLGFESEDNAGEPSDRSNEPADKSSESENNINEPAITSTGNEPAITSTGNEPASTSTGNEPASTSTGNEPASTSTGMEPSITATSKEPGMTTTGMEPGMTTTGMEPGMEFHSPGMGHNSSHHMREPTHSSNMIDEDLLIEEMLNILNSLNKNDLSDEDKSKIRESLDNIENIIVNADLSQFSDNNKFSLIMKLLTQNRKLLNKNSDAVELEAIRSTFGTGPSARGAKNYANRPQLPSISQFKPTGTSNIFSPVIEVKSSPFRNNNNKRYSNAYEKGFEKGMRKAQATLGETNIIDQSTQITDTTVQQQITSGDTTYDKSFRGVNVGNKTNVGYTDSEGRPINSNNEGNNNTNSKSSTTSENGYIRKDNGREIQKPGYSYLDPKLWSMPRKRTPVCFSSGDMDLKENSLDPAGFVFGGPSNVMEFHGVGSILPKFSYKEQVNEVETEADI